MAAVACGPVRREINGGSVGEDGGVGFCGGVAVVAAELGDDVHAAFVHGKHGDHGLGGWKLSRGNVGSVKQTGVVSGGAENAKFCRVPRVELYWTWVNITS